jgi:hypothetical protein
MVSLVKQLENNQMKYYVLRDEQGIMKAAVSAQDAAQIFSALDGHWRTSSDNKRIYQIDVDGSWDVGGRTRIYLWKGDMLVESTLDPQLRRAT